uniref:Uncharacterized protein n=1 Tax=Siphoviridae sp. cttFh17 TaxID=2826491 RepID=A0A8S5NJL0_9CAUD|nr:MAG TPA: hypothetical protein [Siphoviridae sp. cttFh17]
MHFLEQFAHHFTNKKRINNQEVVLIEWYAFYHDINRRKIIKWNIFEHSTFRDKVEDMLKENLTKEEFSAQLKKELMYYMWSKSEYELILHSWIGDANDVKIDIYDQVTMNWGSFVDYVWKFRKEK